MFDWLEFVVSEALTSLRRNALLTFAACVTIAISLFLIGGFSYVYFRAQSYAKSLPNEFQMRVFLKDSVEHSDFHTLAENLRSEPGISAVQFMPKEAEWNIYRKNHPEIPDGISNSLPNGFNLVFKNLKYASNAAATIQKWPQVDKVVYQADVLKSINQGLELMRYIGMLGLILFAISGILVFNAIRFTVIARRTEIRVMQLIGASQITLRTPFIIEGIFQGLVGGILATWSLLLVNAGVDHFISGLGLSLPSFPTWSVMGVLVIVGAILGAGSSTIAIRVPLRYQ